MVEIIGIALWALVPGVIAKKKGRKFWVWYFLSFLISPLLSIIIVSCLSNISENKEEKANSKGVEELDFCRKCGEPFIENSNYCRKCGTKKDENVLPTYRENCK